MKVNVPSDEVKVELGDIVRESKGISNYYLVTYLHQGNTPLHAEPYALINLNGKGETLLFISLEELNIHLNKMISRNHYSVTVYNHDLYELAITEEREVLG